MSAVSNLVENFQGILVGSLPSNGDHPAGLSKGFLNFASKYRQGTLAKREIHPKTARNLYAAYLDEFIMVGMDINLNCFNRWSRGKNKFYHSLYGPDDRAEPKNFDVRKQYDVTRIGELLGQNIVIFFLREPSASEDQSDVDCCQLDLFHQYSDSVSKKMLADSSVVTVTYLLTSKGRLYHVVDPDGLAAYAEWEIAKKICERYKKGVKLSEVGLGEALCRLLEVDDSYATCPVLSKVLSTHQLICADRELKSVLNTIEGNFVIAVYTRRGGMTAKKQFLARHLNKSCFDIVYLSSGITRVQTGENYYSKFPQRTDVNFLVCLGGTDVVVVPKKIVQERIYTLIQVLPAEDKFESSYIFSGLSAGRDFEDKLREKRKKARDARKRKLGGGGSKEACKTFCLCQLCCDSAKEYEFNMDEEGPEKLLTVDFGCRELLRLAGLDSEKNLAIVEKMASLSIAAFDIESKTVEVDQYQPDKNLFSQLDPNMSVEGHYTKVQRPIMLAHMDGLDTEEIPETWTVEGDDERQAYRMMENYYRAVEARKKRCQSAKEELCRELKEDLAARRQRVLDFTVDYFEKNPSSEEEHAGGHRIENFYSAYRNGLLGKLEARLTYLCEQYVVFSFYGSGYDHIILFSYLAPLWYEMQLRPRVEKRGNKISSITLRSRVTFRDITKMLAPGTDLRNFGKLFGLEQKKAHFPFSLLTSADVLQQEGLPSDHASWKSDLGGSPVSPEDIAEAQKLYEEAGCKTLGDYLRTYLKLDVVVLYKAGLLWRQHLVQLTGVDFVESRKFTISSMSNYAGTMCQAQKLRVGSFFPNNRRTYGLFKQGMRG